MITLENVRKVYRTNHGRHCVLDNITTQITKGEKIGILGKNGAGKSTLIRLISGAELPTSGYIKRGMSVSWPLAFGGAFQGSLTGRDNARFICRVYGASIETVIPFVLEFSELGKFFDEPVKTYSSGMASRLAFSISMAIEFDCFLIDEIVAVGDSRFSEKCNHELFQKRMDRTMIIVSHQPDLIRRYCSTAAVLHEGHLTKFDKVEAAFEYYENIE